MKFDFKKILPHIIALAVFIIASLAYFYPVLSGKKLYQNDIVQYKGNARQLIDYRADTGEELYWTDALFGGMPTYQLGARYEYDIIDQLDRAIRFLPRPADYLFLYLISFYILMMVMRVPWKIAIIGAFAFGFSTYLIIILGVGHNAKAHAIAYFPLVLSGIILVFQRRYIAGFLLTAIAMALELQANHPQMTYYLFLAVLILGLAYLIDAIRKKLVPHFFKSVAIMAGAVLLALGTNAANLMATSEYSKESTRGKSEITVNAQGESVTAEPGLKFDYITEYSYGIAESWNMLIPRFAGGGNSERPSEDSNAVEYIMKLGLSKPQAMEFTDSSIPLYWGAQPIVEAPAYLGAAVVFLAVLALFLIEGRLKWWTVGVIVMAISLSYGKNLEWLTRLFVDYFPLYNKFRAITSILVLVELCIPILAVVGLYHFFNNKKSEEQRSKALLYSGGIVGGILVVFALLGGSLFDFASPYDAYLRQDEQLGSAFVDAVRQDRWELMRSDTLRSLLFVGLVSLSLFLFLKKKTSYGISLILIGAVILIDLVSFDLNYVNEEDFVTAREYENVLPKTPADEVILREEGHYRVYDLLSSPNNSARASAYHKAMGGYHGAKPARFQDLVDFYLVDEQGNPAIRQENIEILSMFNTRYIIDQNKEGTVAKQNPLAMGNGWFVNEAIVVADQNEELLSLKNLKGDAIGFITEEQKDLINLDKVGKDSLSSIELIDYNPQRLVYETKNSQAGLAVFSEMYYPHGWNATIDGNIVPIARVNYALRGLYIPAGSHKVVFAFEPEVVKTGSMIMLGSNVLLAICILGGLFFLFKTRNSSQDIDSQKGN
jgi:hypothetical protein